jgi:hypothetical protein
MAGFIYELPGRVLLGNPSDVTADRVRKGFFFSP